MWSYRWKTNIEYVREDDDYALGEAIVDMYGDIKELGADTIKRYVDYEKSGIIKIKDAREALEKETGIKLWLHR